MAKKENSAFTLVLCILLACTALAVAYAFMPKSAPGQDDSGRPTLTLELERAPFVDGNTATAHVLSTCGGFELSLDGQKAGESEMYLDFPFFLSPGGHTLRANGSGCSVELPFLVLERECFGNQTKPCTVGDCAGLRSCQNGIFSSECSLPRKICVPGEKIGCSTDGCKFGYSICNSCGSGFGPCLPPAGDGKNNSTSCISTGCN